MVCVLNEVTLFTSVWKQWISMLEVFRQSQFLKIHYCIQICREKRFASTTQHLKPKSKMCCSSCFKSVLNIDNSTGMHRLGFKIHRFKVTLSVLLVVRPPQHLFHNQRVRKHLQTKQNKVLSNAPEGATFGSRLLTSQNLTAVLKMAPGTGYHAATLRYRKIFILDI